MIFTPLQRAHVRRLPCAQSPSRPLSGLNIVDIILVDCKNRFSTNSLSLQQLKRETAVGERGQSQFLEIAVKEAPKKSEERQE